MKNLNRCLVRLLSLALLASLGCEHKALSYLDEYNWRGYTFPVAVKIIDGVRVHYVVGLVIFTTKPNVTITQLHSVINNLDGEIMEVYQSPGITELDVIIKIPFSLDPFAIAKQLERSPLIKYAEPVYLGTPE